MTGLVRYRMLIDGAWVDAGDGGTFESMTPATGEPWAVVPEATAADVDRAVEAAHRAFTEGPWSRTTPTERGRSLRRLADLLADRSEQLGRTETVDTGKMLKETRWQAKYIADFFHFFAGCADKVHGATLPIDKPDLCVFTAREPLGVVAAVVPWNSQLFLVAVKLGPALAAGNTVVLKASEHASAAMLEFGRLIEEAGIPSGVVNIVTGHGDPCGRVLTSHPLVARVSFTGGPESARHVVRNSAENFAQVSLELGGKSPFVVFEDADLESAVNGSIAGIFGASGQSCVAGSRLYLQERIADRFLDDMVSRARSIVIGDPLEEATQMGPLATTAQLERIEKEVAGAVEEGGTVLHGGRRPARPNRGWYYEPTIVDCPRQSMRIRRHRAVRPGAERAALPRRGGGRRAGQRHPTRPGRRHLHPRQRPLAAGRPRRARRHRLGEHLPRGVAHRRVRRLQGLRLRARERFPGHLRLHPAEDHLDEPVQRADGEPVRDAVARGRPLLDAQR